MTACPRCSRPVRSGSFTCQDTNRTEVLTVEDVTLPGSQVPRTRVHECDAGDDDESVTIPRTHLRNWSQFLRALVQQGAVKALNARDAVEDNAAAMDRWAAACPGRKTT